jgi:hypothetical protein
LRRLGGVSEAGASCRNPERQRGIPYGSNFAPLGPVHNMVQTAILRENKQIRFRDSWFIRAGFVIAALSTMPLALVMLFGSLSNNNIEVGPTFLWLVLGRGLGFLCMGLGLVGVLVQRVSQNKREQ